MSKLCIGFEAHQPFRLDPHFSPENGSGENPEGPYFNPLNREILERVADKCYIPATGIILENLDRGFKCAFSISGTLVEQLERWRPDALEWFKQVAAHENTEMLAQTYYHSVASLFDLGEFEHQVRLHRKMVRATFGVEPKVMENTEFILDNGIAKAAAGMGFKAIYAEGVERVLGWRSPEYVYSCRGIRLLLRNYRLSDDIAFRFNNRAWDGYPLTAARYASWIAATPGDYVNVFVDFETFGEHHWAESGILGFLRWLPRECMDRGVGFILPSEAAEIAPKDELSLDETISWADAEKDASAWRGNALQRSAFRAIRRARAYAQDERMWRYLQTSDHFYYMASKFGACAEVHRYFSPDACQPYDAFATYMKVLAHYERESARGMKSEAAALKLRTVVPAEAFNFNTAEASTGFTAYSLDDLCDLLKHVPEESVAYHVGRHDISGWARTTLGDRELADALDDCRNRRELAEVARNRRDELWKCLK